MRAPQALCVLCLLVICALVCGNTMPHDSSRTPQDVSARKFEVFDGVHLTFPQNASTLFSVQIDTNKTVEEGRGKKKKEKLMQKLLPLFIMPFLIQSTIIPVFLSILKLMLVKSLMIGKLALVLIIINAFKNHNSFNGRHDADIANVHYGYHGSGMEGYGSYVH